MRIGIKSQNCLPDNDKLFERPIVENFTQILEIKS